MSVLEKLFVLGQYPLPHHLLSRLMGQLTHSHHPWIRRQMIERISKAYGIDLSEALESNPEAYGCFNAFFTRALKPEARPIDPSCNGVASPADGYISQKGAIKEGAILQAKGIDYTARSLLGGDRDRAIPFEHGTFLTIYLSPRDYHRLHMPISGTLREMIHVPGRLFSVNDATARGVPGLFARNERVVALFDTAMGPMALVLVGAIFVASIETVWHGVVTPPRGTKVTSIQYPEGQVRLKKGDEMGRFNMGSTIVVLFGHQGVQWNPDLVPGHPVKMGEKLGMLIEGI